MSNPLQDKATNPGSAKPEERESFRQTSDQQIQERFHDDIHIERTKQGGVLVKIDVNDNVRLHPDGKIVPIPEDKIDRNNQSAPKTDEKIKQEKRAPYPEAEVMHDASGAVHSIGLKADKDHQVKAVRSANGR